MVRYCVLIPSRGRAELLGRGLSKMPWLDDPDTIIGYEAKEHEMYQPIFRQYPNCRTIRYANPMGSVAVAREHLRAYAVKEGYDWYVVTDDNAIHKSQMAVHNLVRCAAEWVGQPVIVAGMHNTAMHFDRGKVLSQTMVNGLSSYPSVAMIFQTYPHAVYAAYQYPEDAYGLDDRHFFLWCIARGIKEFRVCMDAPFTKTRYQKGGQGSIEERMEKTGQAIARLALDFPRLVGATGTLRIPWQFLLSMQDGSVTADRLVGGSMRKENALLKPKATVRRRTVKIGGAS